MKLKKHLFGQSIVWLGVLCSTSKEANAETLVPFLPNGLPQEGHHPTEEVVMLPVDRLSADEKVTPGAIAPERFSPINSRESVGLNQIIAQAKQSLVDEIPSSNSNLEADPEPNVEPPLNSQELTNNMPVLEETDEENQPDNSDPELGNLRLRERPLPPPPSTPQQPSETVFLLGRLNYLRSDNILLDDFDPVDDNLFQVGVSLVAIPSLGRQTQLVAAIGANLTRYGDLSDLNYNNLELQVGIQQGLSPRTYGEISWTNQHYFSADSGDRFLNDHSLRLTVAHREQLAPQLTLDGFYQLRFSFTDPADRSRISNTLGASLNYDLRQNLGVGLDYQFVLTNFTQQEREDGYHQLIAQLNYDLSSNNRVSLFGGLSFGRSSDPDINFNSTILGISFSTNLALF